MLVSELDFALPPQLIAQEPAEPRDHSRLMRLQRENRSIIHHRFDELPQLLRADDLLVFNDTRVLHARLHGYKSGSGGRVEALLLREKEVNLWEALLKPSARLKIDTPLVFESIQSTQSTLYKENQGKILVQARPVERTPSGWVLRFESKNDVREILPFIGEMPTPPYIKRPLRDKAEYQTVFARHERDAEYSDHQSALDSAAAPTAGLHFTPRLLDSLHARGIHTAFVTLGVGIGTFRPIQTEVLEEHIMHREEFVVPAATSNAVAQQRKNGGRVVVVGTTTTRVLESVADDDGNIPTGAGSTEIFIRPGYRFRCVDAMLTNFHLPRSSLLAMIGAFAGLDFVHEAYREAVQREYRFFSFGDAMFIE